MFGNNWSAKMEGASTDKLSSHTVDEGACAELTYAVWKQWQSAIQWSGVEKYRNPYFPKPRHRYTHTYLQTGRQNP